MGWSIKTKKFYDPGTDGSHVRLWSTGFQLHREEGSQWQKELQNWQQMLQNVKKEQEQLKEQRLGFQLGKQALPWENRSLKQLEHEKNESLLQLQGDLQGVQEETSLLEDDERILEHLAVQQEQRLEHILEQGNMVKGPWMMIENLPQIYRSTHIPSNIRRFSFQGKVDVEWRKHVVPILWALDRAIIGLPPIIS
ncbi:unnamed protein product, partial [Darwinula stevensoni]